MTGSSDAPDGAAPLPSRMIVYQQACELQRIAQQAAELATAGPRADLPRAVRLLARARAVLGSE